MGVGRKFKKSILFLPLFIVTLLIEFETLRRETGVEGIKVDINTKRDL